MELSVDRNDCVAKFDGDNAFGINGRVKVNVVFPKGILQITLADLPGTNHIIIVTDGFHQYRASLLAKRAGLSSESESAKTNPLYVPTYWVREWMALFQLLVFGHG